MTGAVRLQAHFLAELRIVHELLALAAQGFPGGLEALEVDVLVVVALALFDHLADLDGVVEVVLEALIDLVLEHIEGSEDPVQGRYPWYVLAEVSGQGEPGSLSEPFTDALGAAAEAGLIVDAAIASSGAQAKKFWQMREDMAEAQKRAGPSIKHDVSVPVSRIPEFLEQTGRALEAAYPGINLVTFGHVGDGNLHFNPQAPDDWTKEAYRAEREAINRIVHDIVISHGGSISAEHGVGRLRLDENMHYKSPVEIDLMRTIKKALDPQNIMNPGKVIRL